MKAKELEFIPVILGGDITTYSLARSFHEEYGIKSIAISTVKNWLNSYSSIIDNIIEPKMNDLDTFLKRLTSLGEQYLGRKKLILIACGDWYVRMIIENRDTLEKYYVIPYIQEELLNKLVLKDSFYDICEKTGVDYPKTFVYDVKEKTELDLPFDFPVIAKPASSAEYHYAEFPGKKKVFKFNSMDELKTMLSNLEKSSYPDLLRGSGFKSALHVVRTHDPGRSRGRSYRKSSGHHQPGGSRGHGQVHPIPGRNRVHRLCKLRYQI